MISLARANEVRLKKPLDCAAAQPAISLRKVGAALV